MLGTTRYLMLARMMADSPFRILVAEDELIIRWMMVETLQEAGYDVLEASDGTEACKLIEDPDHIAALVTDLHMPGADGITVAQCARDNKPDMPILFVSARSDLLATLPAPIPYSYLPKPFLMSDLALAVSKLIDI